MSVLLARIGWRAEGESFWLNGGESDLRKTQDFLEKKDEGQSRQRQKTPELPKKSVRREVKSISVAEKKRWLCQYAFLLEGMQ